MGGYVELRAKSFYSFGEGASGVHELLARAVELGQPALALTDSNLCGALEFARLAVSLGVRPITGGELTLTCGSRVALLAENRAGYSNLCRLFSIANSRDRREPRLDPAYLPGHADGVILLTGGRGGPVSRLANERGNAEARRLLREYMDWYGSDSVYVEIQRNFLSGDTARNRRLLEIAGDAEAGLVATNGVLYHVAGRHRLQHALVAVKLNATIDQALPRLLPNDHSRLKSAAEMERLFGDLPEAVANTAAVAERCGFDLTRDLGYRLPEADPPEGYTADSYLRRLCHEAAFRRYGGMPREVDRRLEEELGLIERLGLAGFLLLYREIALIARGIMEERGLVSPETPIEERSPGRGRGSSVALLVGYLIGISHVDPLRWDLTLDRFISDDMTGLPDIDLDFPRSIRDELIRRVHRRFGAERAVLVGAVSTYRTKGVIRDLGKALGLPRERLDALSKRLRSRSAAELRSEMERMPDFAGVVDAPGWRALLELAPQLEGAPKGLGQHVGGMILSGAPIPEMVPTRPAAMEGRFIMDWDKDSVADAGFAKIDILSLPVLDQMEETLDLVERRTGSRPDLGAADPNDPEVYDMINAGRAKGVFLLQSPAQLAIARRLKSRNLLDLAYQVALIRPGVGVQGSAVSEFIERYRRGAEWDYDHPLEARALERGRGIIVWQEQAVQLLMDVGGFSASEADEVRRAFAKSNAESLLEVHRDRFVKGARARGVPKDVALRIFTKVNGHYMFPESHSHAFGVTAYQAAWLKRYHPLEFFVALMNQQPMGFYPAESLKQDARRFGVPFLNPCANRSAVDCSPADDSVLLGLRFVRDVGVNLARLIVSERDRGGPYAGAGDLARRTGLKPRSVESLAMAGAFDAVAPNRRAALWDAGLGVRPGRNGQAALPASTDDGAPELADFTDAEKMAGEYATMGLYPRGHLMEFVRPSLPRSVVPAAGVEFLRDGAPVAVAGWPVARQHPKGRDGTVFVTIEDETGDAQAILWSRVFARYERELNRQVVMIAGRVSRWDGVANVVASSVRTVGNAVRMPPAHDWR